jgi:hypothetical protein
MRVVFSLTTRNYYDYYYDYVFRLKTPIVVENDTEMDPVRSTAGG